MYLYRAIFNLYLSNFDAAMEDLIKSQKQHAASAGPAKKEPSKEPGAKALIGIETNLNEEEMFGKFPMS